MRISCTFVEFETGFHRRHLYPRQVNLWQQVNARISEFVCNWLEVTPEEARKIQRDCYQRFGKTIRGRMTLHGSAATIIRLCAPNRSFAAGAKSGIRRGDRETAGALA
ncbi:putative Fe-S protein YdhL (DUF1289 family) [Bradyrhizobium sp. USDA 3311]